MSKLFPSHVLNSRHVSIAVTIVIIVVINGSILLHVEHSDSDDLISSSHEDYFTLVENEENT